MFCLLDFEPALGQQIIQGKIIDSVTREPIPSVNISINGGKGNIGTTSNIDGRYWLKSNDIISSVEFSHISYKSQVFNNITRVINITLAPKNLELKEAIVMADDRGRSVINNVILNSDKNNYEKLCSFTYMGYDKFIVDRDSISNYSSVDTLITDQSFNMDTLTGNTKFDSMYFFMTESIFKRKHMLSPARDNTEVIASRVSGMKDPFIQMLVSQIPVSNVYTPHIAILGTHYLTPFTKENAKRYFFNLEDVIKSSGASDSTFVVSFHPKHNTSFDGIDGIVYVNAQSFAIERIIFQPYAEAKDKGSRLITPEIELIYQMVDSVMMPKSIDYKMIVKMDKLGLGANSNIIIKGVRQILDIKINPKLRPGEFSRDDLAITATSSRNENEAILERYRMEPLSDKEKATYMIIDSLVRTSSPINVDKLVGFLYTASNGAFPVSFLNVHVADIIGLNDLEGWTLGVGLSTNEKMLKWMSIYGFIDYGFKNKKIKWGTSLTFNLNKYYDIRLVASYQYKPVVAGSEYLAWRGVNIFNANTYREFLYLANKYEYAETETFGFEASPFKDFKFKVVLGRQSRESVYDYYYGNTPPPVLTKDTVINTSLEFMFRYKYGEKSTRLSQGRITSASAYPEIILGYTHYFKNFLGGSQEFNKIELSVTGNHNIGRLGRYGTISYQANAGYIDAPVEFTNMFSQYFSYSSDALYIPYTFSVMRPNEFVSDLYANVFIKYSTPSLFSLIGIIKPKIGVAFNAGWGAIVNGNKEMHHFNPEFKGTRDYSIKEMNLGYYETGLILDNIIDVKIAHLGFATHYRFGPYHLPKLGNNFSYNITVSISL